MIKLPPSLPETGRNGALHGWLNELRDSVRSLDPVEGFNQLVNHTAIGVARQGLEAQQEQSASIKQFKLTRVFDDWIECREFDGTTESTEFTKIAKPYKLRRTPFDLQSFEFILEDPLAINQSLNIAYHYYSNTFRTATVTGTISIVEKQIVIPIYRAGDVIYATQPSNFSMTISGETTDWLDINADSRAWARKE